MPTAASMPIVIEGEQEAHQNYCQLAERLPDFKDELLRLAKMENRHKKGFQACGQKPFRYP